MQKSHKQFAEFVRDAERAAARNLAGYKLRPALFAPLGDGVIFIFLSIPAALRAGIVAQLKALPALKGVWLAQKPMRHYPEVPALAIAVATEGLFSNGQKTASAIEVVPDLDGTGYIVPRHGDYKRTGECNHQARRANPVTAPGVNCAA